MLSRFDGAPGDVNVFQSAPGREAGRCKNGKGITPADIGFNPRPAVRPGDAGGFDLGDFRPCGFNPRPAVRPGDAELGGLQSDLKKAVSIRARP